MRKLYRAFLLTITSDTNYGSMVKSFTDELKRLCVGRDQFYWKQCRSIGQSLHALINTSSICGNGRPPFEAFSYTYYNNDGSKNFLNLVKTLTGKSGSFLLLGVGLHMDCDPQSVINNYFAPAVNYKEDYYSRIKAENTTNILLRDQWPRMIFLPPDTPGLLKPLLYSSIQGRERCRKYSDQMKQYCDQHEIPVLNFQSLTENTVSYDGTHYGIGVNLMKVQILINYIESLAFPPQTLDH